MHYYSMGHVYKYLGSDEQKKKLWQNREAIEKYIARLKEFWDEENQCWLEKPKDKTEWSTNTKKESV